MTADPIDLTHERLERERRLLGEAEEQLDNAEAAVAAIDLPDGKAFDKAVRERDALRSRRDALRDRVRFAEAAVEAAKARAAEQERAKLESELRVMIETLAEADRQIEREVSRFDAELMESCRIQREYLDRIIALEARLGTTPDRQRSFWAGVAPGDALHAAWIHPASQQSSWRQRLEARAQEQKLG